jgi:hypothetical protein
LDICQKNKVPLVRAVRSQNLGGEARPAEPALRHLPGLWPRPLRCSPMLCRLRRGGAKDLAREWPRQPKAAAERDIAHWPMAAATSTHSKTIVRLCLSRNFDTESGRPVEGFMLMPKLDVGNDKTSCFLRNWSTAHS